jgi:hypothetical protein
MSELADKPFKSRKSMEEINRIIAESVIETSVDSIKGVISHMPSLNFRKETFDAINQEDFNQAVTELLGTDYYIAVALEGMMGESNPVLYIIDSVHRDVLEPYSEEEDQKLIEAWIKSESPGALNNLTEEDWANLVYPSPTLMARRLRQAGYKLPDEFIVIIGD